MELISYVGQAMASSHFLQIPLPTFTTLEWASAAVAALCIGMSKSGLSGISMVAILLMAQVFPPRESTGVILPMLIAADFLACSAFWEHAQWRYVFKLLPPAIVGVIIGYFAMRLVPDGNYRRVIGGITLAMATLQGLQMRHRHFSPAILHQWPFAVFMGILTGVVTMMANAAGPVAALYLTVINLPKMPFIATAAFLFLITNLIKAPLSAAQGLITGPTLLFNLYLLPAIAAGVFLGRWVIHRVSQRVFEVLIVTFSILTALKLIFS